jgi:hypothetical protein
MNHRELWKMIDEVLNPESAQTTLDIYKYIDSHKRAVVARSESAEFIKIFGDFFHELNIVISYLNLVPKNNWKRHKKIQYLLYPEVMKTLHRALEDTTDGYYEEAMMLLRSVYETFLRIAFLSCYPENWEAIFYNRKNKMNFEVTGFVKNHLKLKCDFIYGVMSDVHHSKKQKNLSSLIRRSKSNINEPIRIEYRGNKKLLWRSFNYTIFSLCCLFHAMMSIFLDDFDKNDQLKVREERLKKIDLILLGLIETNPDVEFASLAKDIKKVGEIIKSADSGEDWKKIDLHIQPNLE